MVENDQNNRTAFWERVSDVLNQYERSLGTVDINSLEIVRVRMEYIILALQQILPLWLGNRPLACVLEETLNNFRTLCLHWNCNLCQSRNGQGVALYCTVPNVKRSNRVGRPQCFVSEEQLLCLRSAGFTWTDISKMFLVSRWTLGR